MPNSGKEFFRLKADKFEALEGCEFYSVTFADRKGWAYLVLHEQTGLVAIISDYGSWSNVWHPKAHQRSSLKAFICEGDFDYLTRKLLPSDRWEKFDLELTLKQLKKTLLENRRSGNSKAPKEDFRDVWDFLEAAEFEELTSEGLYNELPKEHVEVISEWVPELFVSVPTPEFMWLKHGILPALVTELTARLPVAA